MQVASAGGFLFYRFIVHASANALMTNPATDNKMFKSSTFVIIPPPLLYAVAEETTRRPYLPTCIV